VARGYHTTGQVAVGLLLGSAVAATWLHASCTYALPTLLARPGGAAALYGATACAVCTFGWRTVSGWLQERR
jgi:hypothetical protein